jgi:hypothetical protein
MTEKPKRSFWRLEGTWGKVYRWAVYILFAWVLFQSFRFGAIFRPEQFGSVIFHTAFLALVLFFVFKAIAAITRSVRKAGPDASPEDWIPLSPGNTSEEPEEKK